MAGRSFVFPVAVLLLFLLGSVFTSPTSNAGTAAGVVVKVLMAVLILYLVLGLFLQLAGFDGDGASRIAKALSADSDQQRLLHRWLDRARWARFVGGLSGILVFLFSSKNGASGPAQKLVERLVVTVGWRRRPT
jgi:ABC-type amino acid transport substrate-binding protein